MKVLLVRFSSIGDLTQSLSIPSLIHEYDPKAEIHFITREDLGDIVQHHPAVHKLWLLNRKKGLRGLFQLIKELKKENYTHIYDAHNNLRSFLIRWLVPAENKLVRPMMRWKRFLLLNFHINLFEKPFSGQRDLLKPLEKWGFAFRYPRTPQLFLSAETESRVEKLLASLQLEKGSFTVLVPSAAFPLKRWPLSHWKKLIENFPQEKFVILAGAQDSFLKELDGLPHLINLQGQTSLLESAAVVKAARSVVANDTGLLHFAEQLGKHTIALMGPAPFGFPSREKTIILERNLPCRPCSKHGQGPCVNPRFQECLDSISHEEVASHLKSQWAQT